MKREELKQLNRQKILAAATALMTRQGIDATGMKDVSLESGISIVTMYKYFPTKEELAEDVILDFYHERFHPIIGMIEGPDATFAEIMYAFKKETEDCERVLGEDVFLEFQEVIKTSKKVADFIYKTKMSLMSSLLQKGRQSGDINTRASNDVVVMIMSTIFTQLWQSSTDFSREQMEGIQEFFRYGAVGRPND